MLSGMKQCFICTTWYGLKDRELEQTKANKNAKVLLQQGTTIGIHTQEMIETT